jgi:glycosyltransferase involved in cell wall biosynthesis
MARKTILISINAAWNILNFRMGLIRALQEKGYRVVALAPPDEYGERLAEHGVEYHALPMDKQGTSPLRDLALFGRYLAALSRIRPDVFLAYTAKPNVYGSLAAQALGIRVINNVSGLGTAFIREGLITKVISSLYRLAFRRSATVFFQNGEDRDLFVERGLVRNEKARLLPGSGVDITRFRPASGGPDGGEAGPFTFLLVARLLWDKGVGEYVEAARLVRREAPDTRFQLLGFLDVPNRTAVPRGDVERWVEEGLVEYLGASDDVRPHIAASNCVVLPSYREGLPRTLLEAAAMAKPLIATDVPGCRHVVEDGVNGYLCRVRDGRSLADAMLRLVRLSAAERTRLGLAGRARIEAEYDERLVISRYLTAIEDAAPRP